MLLPGLVTIHLHSPPPLRRLHLPPACRYSPSSSSFRPNRKTRPHTPPSPPARLPARDRVIDFGRHKGKRLGSLPSSYLRWASENLRCRDTAEWAKLADEVLADPVYNDRLEWEHAHRVLSGDGICEKLYASVPNEDVFDIADRFGWDFQNDDAWSSVDFELLGTSFGGRIPRKSGGDDVSRSEHEKRFSVSRKDAEPSRYIVVDEKGNQMDQMDMLGGKRAERRDRKRGKREQELRVKRLEQIRLVKEEIGGVKEEEEEGVKFKMNSSEKGEVQGGRRLFPGRGALLDKIRKRNA